MSDRTRDDAPPKTAPTTDDGDDGDCWVPLREP
jgi:hypothetical protein